MIDTVVLSVSLAAFAASAVTYGVALRGRVQWSRWCSTALFVLGLALVSFLIAKGWWTTGRPPFKTLYESLLLFVFCTSLVHLWIERLARLPLLGVGVSSLMTAAVSYALIRRDLEATSLPPALQSPWFVPHVLVYFTGYGTLLLAAVAAGAYLARPAGKVTVQEKAGDQPLGYEQLMHRLIVVGYVLITAGIIMGAIWAKEAWGSYWSWDPKENWALISWLTYTLYFHMRRFPGWRERGGAILAIAGFAVIMFTYLGVSLLPNAESSVHVYK